MTEEKQTAMQKVQAQMKPTAKSQTNGTFAAVLNNPENIRKIASACAKHITPERLVRIASTAVQKNESLLKCTPLSLLAAIIDCAQLGLEPIGPLGHCYLVSYNNWKTKKSEVQLQLGYKGMIALGLRSGKFHSIEGDTIHENDEFSYTKGSVDTLKIKPAFPGPRGKIVGAYAKAVLKDPTAQPIIKVINTEEIHVARDLSKAWSYWSKNKDKKKVALPIWELHYAQMCVKTAIRKLAPFLSMAPEMQGAISVDEKSEFGIITTDTYSDITANMVEGDSDGL